MDQTYSPTPELETIVINSDDMAFTVRYVQIPAGEPYGIPFEFVSDRALVEFYDRRYMTEGFDPERGQFITRYHAMSMIEHGHMGLDLYGGDPTWRLDRHAMGYVSGWVLQIYRRLNMPGAHS